MAAPLRCSRTPARPNLTRVCWPAFKPHTPPDYRWFFRAGISALDGTPGFGLAPADVGSFFASYTAEIVRLATIAQAGGVATFAIGNEMSSLSGQPYRGYWTDLISAVREVYQGELTYAAATDEALKVSFWDQLDLIGVNTYPPLTSSTTPTVQELVQAWSEVPFNPYYSAAFGNQSPVDFLHSLSQQYGLQVLMTEVGYRSVDGAAIRPGSWTTVGAADTGEQADAFSAFFQVWTAHGGSWMRGVELWQWDLNNQYSSTGYSVMGKPAEAVVSQYFHGDGFAPGLTVTGSPGADSFDLGRGNDAINAGLGDDVILGGAGNDLITAGPGAAERLSTTTITVTGYGSVVGGVGAQTRVSVNGSPVSALFEFRPAADASAYQTMTVTFDNPDAITSFGIELFNATPGRALHIKGLSINGVVLGPEDGVNASAPGSFDLYVRAIQFDATDHQEWFFGASTDNDTIDGGAGNDTIASGIGNDMITAGIGNDVVDGGEGMDWAIFAGNIADYDIDFVDSRISVVDRTAGRDGSDDVANVEFLKFADATVSVLHMTPGPGLPGGGPPPSGTGGAGDVTNQTIRHDDDSGITGHTSEHDVTDRNGSTTSIERFFADDDLAFRQLVNGNGSVERADYDAAVISGGSQPVMPTARSINSPSARRHLRPARRSGMPTTRATAILPSFQICRSQSSATTPSSTSATTRALRCSTSSRR